MSKPARYLRTNVELRGDDVGKFEAYIRHNGGLGGYDENNQPKDQRWFTRQLLLEALEDYEDGNKEEYEGEYEG